MMRSGFVRWIASFMLLLTSGFGCMSQHARWLNAADEASVGSEVLDSAKRASCYQEYDLGCIPGSRPIPSNGVTELTCEEFHLGMKAADVVIRQAAAAPSDLPGRAEALSQTSADVASLLARTWATAIDLDSRMSRQGPYATEATGTRHSFSLAVERVAIPLKERGAFKALAELDESVIRAAGSDGREEAKALAEAAHLMRVTATEPSGSLIEYRTRTRAAAEAFEKAKVRWLMISK